MNLSTSSFRFRTWSVFFLAAVFSLFFLFLISSEWLVRSKVEPNDHYAQSINVFFESDRRNVVFGDSISLYGFRGQPDFVNLALQGETLERTEIKVRGYFQAKRPGRVILGANHNVFQPEGDNGVLRVTPILEANTDPRSLSNYKKIFLRGNHGMWRSLRPTHTHRLLQYWKVFLLKGKFETKFQILPDGTLVPLDPEENIRYARMPETERIRRARNTVMKEIPGINLLGSKAAKIYHSMVKFLRSREADVCLVTYPMSPAFRQAAKEYPAYAAVPVFFENFAKKQKVKYVNYWDRLSDLKDFTNENHLSNLGALKIGKLVVRDCFGPSSPFVSDS
ncbi:MAG: hypothetical protein NPIRA02_16220 [Nitrospirales bacterium]|nr:MAG: hypothetical protein NPIRA02_16220 [Nitrospirales bacterium]